MEVRIAPARSPAVEELGVEIVERKGLGHPDTICDAVAEEFSRALSRYYLERFGRVLHHNVDKVLLRGGAARAVFGGGDVLAPIELYLAGRATSMVGGVSVPVAELAVESVRDWCRRHLRALDPERHLVVHCLVRPGSADLVELFLRRRAGEAPLANDTVVGVGFAPLSLLERTVLAVEARLNSGPVKASAPELGEDVKVLGIRQGRRIGLTVASAFIARHLSGMAHYLERKERTRRVALAAVPAEAGPEASAELNVGDNPAAGSVYLTVTGTSAEAGDDGQTGRGNRVNGLITPYRPMALESLAGKNPVTHAGKLYQVAAPRIAGALVAELGEVQAAECYLASSIGRAITEPRIVDIHLRLSPDVRVALVEPPVIAIVRRELDRLPELWRELVERGLILQ